jgi:hypothetical protein
MIAGSFGSYAAKTARDHEEESQGGWAGGWDRETGGVSGLLGEVPG